jgi:hypothetical protein
MSDARLMRWLELSRRALALPPAARLGELEALCAERAELERSLQSSPPADGVPADLAFELERAERDLQQAFAELRGDLGQRIEALRRARQAATGYRPAATVLPAFISRSV